MAKHLNPLEKEFLIRRYRSNPRMSIKDFCASNGVTDSSLKKWLKQYDEGGLECLARADAEIQNVLTEGVDRPRQVIVSDMTAFKCWYMYFEVTFYFDVFTKEILSWNPSSSRRGGNLLIIRTLVRACLLLKKKSLNKVEKCLLL